MKDLIKQATRLNVLTNPQSIIAMDKPKELCWTCKNLNNNKCPIKIDLNKVNKFHKVQSFISQCNKYNDVKA